ncbi:hypothetical protein ACN47E_000575 [Coniothyrium glycines]
MKLDTAVIQLLHLDADQTSVLPADGGGCSSASTSKIVTRLSDGRKKTYFMKTARGNDAEVMLQGEDMSLKTIHEVVPTLCPQSLGYGRFHATPEISFLVTKFLHMAPRCPSPLKGTQSLAAKLALLHSRPAPIPDGYDKPMFGFPVTTCCGDTAQVNSYKESWAEFYAENRLRAILLQAELKNGKQVELQKLMEEVTSVVVPRLLGDDRINNGKGITPVIVHGDLWSGNTEAGIIGSDEGKVEGVIFDPSACYAHSEYELGIMKMFGGFGKSFLEEYHELCPKTEPVNEYEDRVRLYELYHHLNHYAMFGGGYRNGAMNIAKDLAKKYGDRAGQEHAK